MRLPLSRIRSTIFSPKSVGQRARRGSRCRGLPHAQLEAAVLRQAPLGDVEVRHDLEARDQRRLHLERRPHDLVQHAVDAVADADVLLVAARSGCRSPARDRVGQDAVDELHHRRLLDLRRQRGDGGLLLAPPRSTSTSCWSNCFQQVVDPLVGACRTRVSMTLRSVNSPASTGSISKRVTNFRSSITPRSEGSVMATVNIRPTRPQREYQVLERDIAGDQPAGPSRRA